MVFYGVNCNNLMLNSWKKETKHWAVNFHPLSITSSYGRKILFIMLCQINLWISLSYILASDSASIHLKKYHVAIIRNCIWPRVRCKGPTMSKTRFWKGHRLMIAFISLVGWCENVGLCFTTIIFLCMINIIILEGGPIITLLYNSLRKCPSSRTCAILYFMQFS